MPRLENLSSLDGRTRHPTCHSSRFIPLFFVLSYYFLKAMFWRNGDSCGWCKKVMSSNTHVAESSHGHVSYFYQQENIGAGLGFEQLAFLVSLLRTRARQQAHKHRTFLQHCRKSPFSKLAKPALRFFSGTFPVYVMHTFRFRTWVNKLPSCNEAQNCPPTNFGIRVLSVANRYKLDSPGLEPPCGRDLPYPFRPALWPT